MGSVMLAADALMALRQRYPNTRLILLCGKGLKEGLEPLGLFHEIWTLEDKSLSKLLMQAPGLFRRIWQLPGLWTLDLEVYSRLSTLFSLYTFARNRFGFYLTDTRFRKNIHTHLVYFNTRIDVAVNYSAIVSAMGAPVLKGPYHLPDFPPRKPDHAYGWIALNNTCSELAPERRMPEREWVQLIELLLKAYPQHQIALLGAPEDKLAVQALRNQHFLNESRVQNKAGTFRLPDYYQFLYNECALLASIDSMPLHIAHLLGLPTVSIWGPSAPETRMEARPDRLTVYLAWHCSPCVHQKVLPCGGDNQCMKQQQPGTILAAVQRLLPPPVPFI
jgi:ADP-heptose:LPS heptosyltransferase